MKKYKKFADYLCSTEVQALTGTTRGNYEVALNSFKIFLKKQEATIDNVDADLMDKYTKYLSRNRSGSTIQLYVTVVKLFLRWAGHPVLFSYKIPSEEKKRQQLKEINRWFNEADIDKCLAYDFPSSSEPVKSRNQLLVRLLAETGARIREIASIKAEQFDVGNRVVFLEISKTEPRPAFYSDHTAKLVGDFRRAHIASGLLWEGEVFPSTEYLKQIVTDMLKALGLKNGSDGRGPHTFRHYVATYLYFEGNMPLEDVAMALGDKPDTIRENYLHPTPAMMKRKFDRAMGWGVAG